MTNTNRDRLVNDITQEELQAAFRYVKSTGKLFWKKREGKGRNTASFNARFAGKEAGWLNPVTGYTIVHFKGRPRHMHRLIWTLVHGQTDMFIDHINADKTDNRLKNLRLATKRDNSRNRGKTKANTSGFKGVIKAGRRWVAQIGYGGRSRRIGVFDTPELAHAAYCGAAKIAHGEFFRAA